MKIKKVNANNRKARIELTVRGGTIYPVPYAKLDPAPTPENKIDEIYVDKELGREAATYVLESGDEGSVHVEQALEYNQDPKYMAELVLYKLTLEVRARVESSSLRRREIARRLNTSMTQLSRLLDPTYTKKTMNQLVALLSVLDCVVEVVVKEKPAA